jgi:hypothetical protein
MPAFPPKLKSMVRRQAVYKTGLIAAVAVMSTLSTVTAKNKPPKPATTPDQIEILANLPMTGGPIVRFTATRHYNHSYLYIEHASHSLTLVDVTDARHPLVIANLDLPATGSGTVLTAAGDAALISSATINSGNPTPDPTGGKTVTIVSFADRAHPQTVRQFNKVTCTTMDDNRGLVFLANDEGLWILHRNPAEDPEIQERYAHETRYNN